ncbi:MAG: CopG family transcriptional regulator [Clostridia bacterium]
MTRKYIGRPSSPNTMKQRIFVKVDKKTRFMLDECALMMKMSRSEVVRQGIRRMFEECQE